MIDEADNPDLSFAPFTDQIDVKTQEIKPSSDETYSDLQELADDLPDSSPRFVLLSYPLTLVRSFSSSIPTSILARSRKSPCPHWISTNCLVLHDQI